MLEQYKFFFHTLIHNSGMYSNGIGCALLGLAAITFMVWAIYQGGNDDD